MSEDMSPYCSAHDEWLIMKLRVSCFMDMALHSRYAVTVSAAFATRSFADCSSMEDRRGNKRPYQPKHSPSSDVKVQHTFCP